MARRWLLPALVATMETGWLAIWSGLFGIWLGRPGAEALLPVPAILALIASGWLLTRAVLRRGWPLGRVRLVVGFGSVLAALLAVRTGPLAGAGVGDLRWLAVLIQALPTTFRRLDPAVATLPFALYLWWRGVRRARQPLSAGDVEGAFRWGILAIAIGLILRTATSPTSTATAGTLAAVAIFLFAGFTSVALAQVESMQRESQTRENAALGVNRHWLGFLLALVGLMLLAALVLAQIFAFDLLDALVRPVLVAIQTIILVVLFVVAVPVGLLVEVLVWLVRLIRGDARPAQLPPVNFAAFDQWRDQAQQTALSPEVIAVAKWVLLGLAGLAIVAALLRSVARLNDWEAQDAVDEERDFVWSWPGLRALLRRWLARWSRRRPPIALPLALVAEDAAVPPETWSIRLMYRELLRLGAGLGSPRHPSQTPREYAGHLRDHPALAGDALDTLTEAYVQARYGPESPDEVVTAVAREALERLRAGGNAGPHPRPLARAGGRGVTAGSGAGPHP